MPVPSTINPVQEYWLDAWQRSILMLDILRQRGNTYRERATQEVQHVLKFDATLVRDGRTLPRPVNYALVAITPPDGVKIDPTKQPFVVVDPRAGHGPGIGGMKADSEIGMASRAGHPCYFIGFLPAPVPGQTVEDVCRAEAVFIEDVISRHPHAEGKPVIIANCQAGWQIMMMAAMRPDLAGPIMLAGSPLSYWAGVHGKNPMRYTGGVLGGTWMTMLAGDLGDGIFDGANLVANFESLEPANTYWDKPYNVYANADTEGPRFLDFETWWGSPVLLNAEEMQWIADNLFVGDKLATGQLRTSDGVRLDLRNIRSPIIVFCSWGDNITPPQQALGWITDLYEDERDIVANGQTIVYTLHDTAGHLGIFVSGKVATKQHSEFVACMDMIDLMPPGLYEAVITDVGADTENSNLVDGRYLFSLQKRTLDDIRALGANDTDDDRAFAAASRVSEINCGLYNMFLRPAVQALSTQSSAEVMRQLHPNRVRFAAFSDNNPVIQAVGQLAVSVRENRRPVAPDNPLLALEKQMASWISTSWKAYGAARDTMTEAMFFNAYGSPLMQVMLGLGRDAVAHNHAERDLLREVVSSRYRDLLESRFEKGGTSEAALRALIYIHVPEGGVDERAFAMLRELRATLPAGRLRSMAQLKTMFREQSLLVRLDEERALESLAKLLPEAADERKAAFDALSAMIAVRGSLPDECKRRFKRVEALFAAKPDKPAKSGAPHARRQQPSRQRPHA